MRINNRLLPALFIITLFTYSGVFASPVYPGPYHLEQPDGTQLLVTKHGDDHGMWYETSEGYTVGQGSDNRWYYLRQTPDGGLRLSNYPAHLPMDLQSNIAQHINPHKRQDDNPDHGHSHFDPFDDSNLLAGSHEGNVLILLVEFADQAIEFADEGPWAARIASSDPEARNIADYFDAASYGTVSLSAADETWGTANNGVVGPLKLNKDHPDSGNQNQAAFSAVHNKIFEKAIEQADDYVDFSSFDVDGNSYIDSSELAIVLVVAGHNSQSSNQSPSVNAHAKIYFPIPAVEADGVEVHNTYAMIGELSDDRHNPGFSMPTTLGVFVHELGHLVFYLPDLYDVDGVTNGSTGGIGAYGVMGDGAWGLDYTVDKHAGETPTLPSAWTQLKLEWVLATANFSGASLSPFLPATPATPGVRKHLVSSGEENSMLGKPVLGIARVAKQNTSGVVIQCSEREYFLAQYRTADGYDKGLTAVKDIYGNEYSGVVIYHVNENWSDNNTLDQMLVEVEPANNISLNADLANNYQLWGLSTTSRFDEFSTPNSYSSQGNNSEISVTVGSPSNRQNSISLAIESLCE